LRLSDFEVYSTFFAWMARLGLSPDFSEDGCFGSPETPALVLNPTRPFSRRELLAAESYVRAGGQLLVMDDPLWLQRSTAGPLLEQLGLARRVILEDDAAHAPAGALLPETWLGLPLAVLQEGRLAPGARYGLLPRATIALVGVEADLVDGSGSVIGGHRALGRGTVIVFLRSSVLSQYLLGDVWGGVEPGSKRELYELEYRLLRAITNRDTDGSKKA